jgi:hypothetical protein
MRQTNATIYEDLAIAWKLEWKTAHLLKDARRFYGIIVETNKNSSTTLPSWLSNKYSMFDLDMLLNTVEQKLNYSIPLKPSCGPIMLDFLGLNHGAESLLCDFLASTPKHNIIKDLFFRFKPTFEILELYLHPQLGRHLAAIEIGIYDKTIELLIGQLKLASPTLSEKIRLLLVKACHDKAKSLHQQQDYNSYDEAIKALETAKRYALGIVNSIALDFDLTGLIDNICHSITNSFENDYIRESETKNLLFRLVRAAPFGGGATCQRILNNLLV